MKLALEFHEPDVDSFAASLSARQITEWMAYDAIAPIGSHWIDTLFAHLQHTHLAIATGGRSKATVFDLLPNLPLYKGLKDTPQISLGMKVRAGMAVLAAAFSAKSKKPKKKDHPKLAPKGRAKLPGEKTVAKE